MHTCGGARCVFNQDTTAKLIHNCWGKNQQSALGQFSIGRVGQFSISANMPAVPSLAHYAGGAAGAALVLILGKVVLSLSKAGGDKSDVKRSEPL